MKKLMLYVLVVFLVSCTDNKKEIGNVKKCYEGYKQAILNRDGKEAVSFLDKTTINYYVDMLELAKTIKNHELVNRSFMDKFMIVALRHRATVQELNEFNGETLIIWAVENGMIGKESVQNASIGLVEIKGKSAIGGYINDGKKTVLFYRFNKESKEWKIDLTSLFAASEKALIQLSKQQGMSQKELINYMLEMVSGKEVNPDIWNKMPN